ncbi:DUF3500 domain-containing protein [Pelagicoccus sp. SDUM812002]|nr:DUF3500 domain-containing protein [Pelagicoccus sp. SDUM812002]MDQ8184065.1 DUF3500 domain-containing protein [Pelagicoccus sp. SDUM812002]
MPQAPCRILLSWILALALTSQALVAEVSEVADKMGTAANAFLQSIDDSQAESVQHPFDDRRKDWHFVPRQRKGLLLSAMSGDQRVLAYALISERLSEQGVQTVKNIRSLERVLRLVEGPGRHFARDPEAYHLYLFATPESGHWGWRFEGHHISINATIIEGQGVSLSPRFLGANPAEVQTAERTGFRALANEEDIAFKLVESFTDEQLDKAVFDSKAPWDIFTGAHREVSPLPVEGVTYGEMNTEQRFCCGNFSSAICSRLRTPFVRKPLPVSSALDGSRSVSVGRDRLIGIGEIIITCKGRAF